MDEEEQVQAVARVALPKTHPVKKGAAVASVQPSVPPATRKASASPALGGFVVRLLSHFFFLLESVYLVTQVSDCNNNNKKNKAPEFFRPSSS